MFPARKESGTSHRHCFKNKGRDFHGDGKRLITACSPGIRHIRIAIAS
jgi:hypothetical protein